MREIINKNIILARHITQDDIKEGLNFFSKDEEFIQLGAWKYNEGKELLAHVHNNVERKINRTYEVLYIVSGSIEATIYTIDNEKVETFTVNSGEILVLLESGHGYKILSDNTKVIEIKNGPYLGAEIDRHRI